MVDAAVKKARATQAVHASFAASTAATAVLATQIATDLVSSGYDVRLESRRSVVKIVYHAYEQMMLAAETDAEREHYANAAIQDLHRLTG
jgi:menaquinone-dependent protoporphyrinogen IX oxidase